MKFGCAVCRAALNATTPYPSFSPADFPATQEAALKALSLAEAAATAHPSDSVGRLQVLALNNFVYLEP